MSSKGKRLVVVSNRLPIALEGKGSKVQVKPGKGGLVTALAPVLQNKSGLWIGWSGSTEDIDLRKPFAKFAMEAGYDLSPVKLTAQEVEGFYSGFSNEVVWPLFHDLPSKCNFDPEYFRVYLKVNRKFAKVVAEQSNEDDYIWIHDYHLMHAASMLKEEGHKRKTGFFLHIPFPPADIFLKLPWRSKIIRALMEFDLVGFQTLRDRRNFIQCLSFLCREYRIGGRGPVVTAENAEKSVRVGYFPISIDFKTFSGQARTKEAASLSQEVHDALKRRLIILGADRLDYTKGIPERLNAMRVLFTKYPELQGKVKLVQVVVPSRVSISGYGELKMEIERLVGEINGLFSRPDWVPIHYLYRNLNREELIAYYRAAEMALVTPLRDGMNLVAKEYCSCNISENGVLILSEFAGAAAQLQRWALLVNPYDVEGMANVIFRAYHMDREEKRRRMHNMRSSIRKNNIFRWVDGFLEAAFAKHLNDFPVHDENVL
jgi:trehalose 6-phosphate synthase